MNVALLFSFIGSVFLFLATPGPVTLMVINHSMKYGFLVALSTIIGTNLASLALIVLSFLAIYGVVAINEAWLTGLTLLGAIYLLYFSIELLKQSRDSLVLSEPIDKACDLAEVRQPLLKYVKQGFLVGVSNPKDILFFMAFFPLFFGISDNKMMSGMILMAVWVVLDYGILSLYGRMFSSVQHPKLMTMISHCSAVLLFVIALFGVYYQGMKLWH